MTTISNAAKADSYVETAQANIRAFNESENLDEKDALFRAAEANLQAAKVYSQLALAEVIDRSFPALPALPNMGVVYTSGGQELGEDEINAKLREHVEDTAAAARRAELQGCPHVHCGMIRAGRL